MDARYSNAVPNNWVARPGILVVLGPGILVVLAGIADLVLTGGSVYMADTARSWRTRWPPGLTHPVPAGSEMTRRGGILMRGPCSPRT